MKKVSQNSLFNVNGGLSFEEASSWVNGDSQKANLIMSGYTYGKKFIGKDSHTIAEAASAAFGIDLDEAKKLVDFGVEIHKMEDLFV